MRCDQGSVCYNIVEWRVNHAKHGSSLHLCFLRRAVEFSFVFFYYEEANKFRTTPFWVRAILLLTLILLTQTQIIFFFLQSILIDPSITHQNEIDFQSVWGVRERE